MINEIMESNCSIIKKSLSLLFYLLILSCSSGKNCKSNINDKLLQVYKTPKENLSLWLSEQGVFGSSIKLTICNSNDTKQIESILMRGEVYFPKIDSVIDKHVYIHYNFPRNFEGNILESIDFESVVLGEGLIKKQHLKYKYIFTNVKLLN